MINAEEAGTGESTPLGGAEIDGGELDRDSLLKMLAEILRSQHTKALHGRIRDEKRFKLRLDAVRVCAYVASVYGSILKDKDLTEIERRLEALENAART
jgi:hypothetical protein